MALNNPDKKFYNIGQGGKHKYCIYSSILTLELAGLKLPW